MRITTDNIVTQKKVSGHADESTIARMTVMRKMTISMIKLHTTRFVRSPLMIACKGIKKLMLLTLTLNPAEVWLLILPEIYENVHPVEGDIGNLGRETNVRHEVGS